jgi:hypothetical protein
MYCLLKTQGISIRPWRDDIVFGAVLEQDKLYISISSGTDWNGHIFFDIDRAGINMKLPADYPRINQFPQWFTVSENAEYNLRFPAGTRPVRMEGQALLEGIPVNTGKDKPFHGVVEVL